MIDYPFHLKKTVFFVLALLVLVLNNQCCFGYPVEINPERIIVMLNGTDVEGKVIKGITNPYDSQDTFATQIIQRFNQMRNENLSAENTSVVVTAHGIKSKVKNFIKKVKNKIGTGGGNYRPSRYRHTRNTSGGIKVDDATFYIIVSVALGVGLLAVAFYYCYRAANKKDEAEENLPEIRKY